MQAKHNLKKADVISNTGLERTFSYHLGRLKENSLAKCIKTVRQAHFICSNNFCNTRTYITFYARCDAC